MRPGGPSNTDQVAEEHDGRQFCCRGCNRLVVICRPCDRGNAYCGPVCSRRARERSRREATRRYQRTLRGRAKHRERQRRFRRRQRERESVTHQGSEVGATKSRVQAAPQQERSTDETPSAKLESTPSLSLSERRPREGQRPCCLCGRWCGPFLRTERLALSAERRRPRAPPRR